MAEKVQKEKKVKPLKVKKIKVKKVKEERKQKIKVPKKNVKKAPKMHKYNLYQLNALKGAYEEPYTLFDIFKISMIGAAFFAVISFLTFYYWWLSLTFACIGFIVVMVVIIPANTRRNYELKSWNERNRFVNNFYQLSTNESMPTISIIERLKERANGEFKEEISILHSRLATSSQENFTEAFREFNLPYKKDSIFMQFMEQVEVSVTQGRFSLESMRDLKSFHNDTTKASKSFLHAKTNYMKDLRFIFGMVMLFILVLTFATGFDSYIKVFAHHPIGWIVYGIWYTYLFFILKNYIKLYYDDEVMEMKR